MLAIVDRLVTVDGYQQVAISDVLFLAVKDLPQVLDECREVQVPVQREAVVARAQEGVVDVHVADVEVPTEEVECHIALVQLVTIQGNKLVRTYQVKFDYRGVGKGHCATRVGAVRLRIWKNPNGIDGPSIKVIQT